MKIIKPSVELWKETNVTEHIAKCARVCYRSESKGIESDIKLVNALFKSKHLSMFRHSSVYAIINLNDNIRDTIYKYDNCPYIDYIINKDKIYIATDRQFLMDNVDNYYSISNIIEDNNVSAKEFASTEIGYNLMRYTFCVNTQISTSRELNRVSPNNIAEQSTRYVYDDGTLCQPHWITDNQIEEWNNKRFCSDSPEANYFLSKCEEEFNAYKFAINNYGLNKQDARGLLPLDTATKCIYTYSIKEWKHIIDLRYYGKTGKPHPNAKIIAGMIKDKLNDLGYGI